ncbi:hypothetical protein CQ010_00575 [Arthrobacter sp. MYb211]|nr:hypothetical protein CIK76_16225 [Glutamicibacter sp. BW80]PQZ96603.1 hypothetical protein CQ017_17420 [Arthrobacter sp. MYb224]PRA02001.1 hypothetical protein CQ019_14740 [Arthrobacter sp. MYb229]PRB50510.1 hypothetical protein CQ013_10905 [Arthrobacter sp. MYb216]PRC10372.1 hypothetical protein CQ010_00575 [Arthrobacter sp. MYb211]
MVELVKKLVDEPWPQSDEERENLFAHLGFKSGSQYKLENEESPHQMTELDIGLGGQAPSSWDTYNKEFLGVSVHLYGTQDSEDPAAQSGYNKLRMELTELFGKPDHPWDNEETPPCIWEANGRTIITHLFNRRDSSVMLSVEDSALADIAEADSISS